MMHSSDMNMLFPVLMALHFIAAFAVFVGFVFLFVYIIKTFTNAKLKKFGLWLFLGGIVVCVISTAAAAHMHGGNMMMKRSMMMEGGMMMKDGMGMSMNGMTRMLEGKTGDEFDKVFIQMMIPHHQGAIDMAKLAATNAKHPELKKLATDIEAAQQKEIDMMNGWLKSWGYNQ